MNPDSPDPPLAAPGPAVAVIGAGPAGLVTAETLAAGGAQVDVFEAMPSPGRKFLLAGRGGLNLTHAEPLEAFLARYTAARPALEPQVRAFDPTALREWAAALGSETFVGTSGRVFPREMKASPLLRAWLGRLQAAGVRLHLRHRWVGWAEDGALRLQHPGGERRHHADATVLALGGGSWPRMGSDAAWVSVLQAAGVDVAPLQPANCGFDVAPTAQGRAHWSDYLRRHHAGAPLKTVAAAFTDAAGHTRRQQGEFVLTDTGVEGSLIYAFAAELRRAIAANGEAVLQLDLLPDHPPEQVSAEVARGRGTRSLATHLKTRLGIQGVKLALLHELLGPQGLATPAVLASALKALPLRLIAPRPLAEAISTAGGVRWEALDAHGMLRARPGVFCAGEMLDWEAPTGGYLLTACLANGRATAEGLLRWWAARA